MKYRSLICLLLFLCIGLLSACHQQPESPSEPATPPISIEEQYAQSCLQIQQSENLIIEYIVSESRLIGTETFYKYTSGTASYSNFAQPTMTAVVEEQLKYGAYENAYQEVYCDETAYSTIHSNHFSASLTPAGFIDRQIPAILLDSNIYQTVTAEETADGITLSFINPVSPEAWLKLNSAATMISAHGTAKLDITGAISEFHYTIEYMLGQTQYTYTVTAKPTTPKTLDLNGSHSEHFESSIPLSDLQIPKLLMQVVGDVYSANNLFCESVESIDSAAIPISFRQNGTYTVNSKNSALYAELIYEATFTDGHEGILSSTKQTDLYENGIFSSTIGDNEPEIQEDISAQTMRQYCEDAVLSALFATKYLSAGEITLENGNYRINLFGNNAFVADFTKSVSEFLQLNIGDGTQSGVVTDASGYVLLSGETGLPLEMGLSMKREHQINFVPYELAYTLQHTLSLLP